ncbi:DUF4301 family protein [Desulfoluna sp.]|uniref:DUF4301 family protein n=1 Tax=Desulfoluna sp. TaxID=2045199 RepID=UPI002615D0FE|nr:DUF4301 family protein [Desulfoluna sp.]
MNTYALTDNDQKKLSEKGITEAQAIQQLEILRQGVPYIEVDRPCTLNDGIIRLAPDRMQTCLKGYDREAPRREITKFVPASGAATRMFRDLIQIEHTDAFVEPDWIKKKAAEGGTAHRSLLTVINNLNRFAFYEALTACSGHEEIPITRLQNREHYLRILRYLLHPVGLDYARLPKGLVLFHRYPEGPRTAFEEHLIEAAQYACGNGGICRLHFTVASEHLARFEALFNHVRRGYEAALNTHFELHFSTQKSNTDTLAIDLEGRPFRNDDGGLLFRPGGHGALIENLNRLKGDIVFVKNIDNVVPDRLKPFATRYKKALAGLLISLQSETFKRLRLLSAPKASSAEIDEAIGFGENQLHIIPPPDIREASQQRRREWIMGRLNRPLRVCGMVRNQGEVGGGPFWVTTPGHGLSLQIVESSAVDPTSAHQQRQMNAANHFNPVDLVLGLRDFEGNPFDLMQFVDPKAVFITGKSKAGRALKALELPGLWNGGMSDWNTLFVEVPPETFTPVKTITDLLRAEHLSDAESETPPRSWEASPSPTQGLGPFPLPGENMRLGEAPP